MSDQPKDQTPTDVVLTEERFYRANTSDSNAVAVGPGAATVPKWVYDEWMANPTSAETVQLAPETRGAQGGNAAGAAAGANLQQSRPKPPTETPTAKPAGGTGDKPTPVQ